MPYATRWALASRPLRLAVVALAVLGAPTRSYAQAPVAATFDGLPLRSIGPAVMGGRIDDVAVVEDRPWVMYVGTASGGLWKTVNAGTTWTPLFDREATSSIGDIAIAPSDAETIWVGTGEPNNRQSSTFGHGVYRSVDGGATWQHMGLTDTHHIGRVVVHPSDAGIVFVAGLGHLWGPNAERGVFRTSDGGATWEKVLFVDDDTGATDLAMDPSNPRILYAATYQRRRTPWGFSGSGPGSGLYRSTDGGTSWTRLTNGLPGGELGRIGLDIDRQDPRTILALVQARDGGLFRSRDRGETWERVNDLNPRPMYYSKIRIDPTDSRRVYVLGAPFYYSDDGGVTFVENEAMSPSYDVGVHGDHHSLWIDPANSNHLVLGGDGGLYVSWDRSRTWDKVNNLPIVQFYSIAVDMQSPYRIYGGAQDTHSWMGPSATRTRIGILNGDWAQINFGDGMYQAADWTDARVVYSESQDGNVSRFDPVTGDRRPIKPYPADDGEPYRFHWTTPIAISPHDSARIYVGGDRLFTSNDRGETWIASDDLTRQEDREALPIMGRVPDDTTLSRHDGTSAWGTITTIAESPVSRGLIWVGTDDGRVQRTLDGGSTWTAMDGRFPGLDDARALVSRVVASAASADRAYVTFDRHALDDRRPYAFVTDDLGESWRPITTGLPDSAWINVIAEHRVDTNLLFVGTETGLYASLNGGERWRPLTGNLPTVPVDDLVVHARDDDLVVGTHGRGIYILDDLRVLRDHAGSDPLPSVHLSEPRVAVQYLPWKHESYGGQRQFVGSNPAYGALLTYTLNDVSASPDAGISIAIAAVDEPDRTLRTLLDLPTAPGIHRVAWDLRTDPPQGLAGARGPLVPSGAYRVTLSRGDVVSEQVLRVDVDSRSRSSAEDERARFDFLQALNHLRGRMAVATDRLQRLREILDAVRPPNPGEAATASLQAAIDATVARVTELRAAFVDARAPGNVGRGSLTSRATGLFAELDGDDVRQGTLAGPTPLQQARLDALRLVIDRRLDEFDRLETTDLPALDRQLAEAGLSHIPSR